MKKWEKEILQKQNSDQVAVLKKLKKSYEYALVEVNDKIQMLQARDQTQSVIYQLKYQEQLKQELESIYSKMNSSWYSTIDEYLKDCYEDGFYQTMYSLHQQGIPMIFPINQAEAVQMAAQTGDGIKLSKKIYQDVDKLTTLTRREITKGIAMNSGYADIARGIAAKGEATLNQAYRITRTESHRIHEEVKFKTINKAKDKGADVVKQWDASIDKRTRSSHIALDGQLRELDQPFKSPTTGHTAMYPGGFGVASEDINCRCVVLQRARWALDKSELDKYVGDLNGMSEDRINSLASNLGVSKDELIKSSNGIIESDGSINHTIKAKNYNQFKKKYQKKAETKKVQLQSQLDLAQQEYDSILSKYKDPTDLLLNGDVNDLAQAGTLQKQITDLQNQLGIKPATATKTIPTPGATSVKQSSSTLDEVKKKVKKFSSDRETLEYHRNHNFRQDFWDNNLSANERTGVVNYTGSDYDEMNSVLRKGEYDSLSKISRTRKNIDGATSALEKSTIADDVTLWRGMGSKNTLARSLNVSRSDLSQMISDGSIVGQTFTEKGFSSTGVIQSSGWNKEVFLEIYAPAGTKGMYVAPISNFKSENELLLQRNTTYKILKAERVGDNYKLYVLVVNQTL